MIANARIICHTKWHTDPLDPGTGHAVPDTWEWAGGGIASIDRRMLTHSDARVGEVVCIGPWRLAIVAHDWHRRVFVTRRLRWAWWYRTRWEISRVWHPIKSRIIATCAVWGLGRYAWGTIPQWTDIHAIAWLKRIVTKEHTHASTR